jgi:iron complex outermembrane receptor protein
MDENQHFTDLLEMLRSHVAGLQVTELPNGEIRLRIRGEQQSLRTDDEANQPLLVIDDMPILPSAVRSALMGVNPRDVESIHVLKDVASTAIYGSRGANGVILIQLKR